LVQKQEENTELTLVNECIRRSFWAKEQSIELYLTNNEESYE